MEEEERARREREGCGWRGGGAGRRKREPSTEWGKYGGLGRRGGGGVAKTTSRERYRRVSQREAREGESERGTGE